MLDLASKLRVALRIPSKKEIEVKAEPAPGTSASKVKKSEPQIQPKKEDIAVEKAQLEDRLPDEV